jgi:hypothetical protein
VFENEPIGLLPDDEHVARRAIRCDRTINQIKYKSRIRPHHLRKMESDLLEKLDWTDEAVARDCFMSLSRRECFTSRHL